MLFKIRLQVFHQSDSHIFLRGETTAVLFVLINWIPLTVILRGEWPSCIKLLVKQQAFNFSHNRLKRCLVPTQDYVEKWQG